MKLFCKILLIVTGAAIAVAAKAYQMDLLFIIGAGMATLGVIAIRVPVKKLKF